MLRVFLIIALLAMACLTVVFLWAALIVASDYDDTQEELEREKDSDNYNGCA